MCRLVSLLDRIDLHIEVPAVPFQELSAVADGTSSALMRQQVQQARAIQERRTFPVRFTQALQLTMQKRIIGRVLASTERPKPPLLFRLFGVFPVLQRIPGRLLAVGVRPEHVHTPDYLSSS